MEEDTPEQAHWHDDTLFLTSRQEAKIEGMCQFIKKYKKEIEQHKAEIKRCEIGIQACEVWINEG